MDENNFKKLLQHLEFSETEKTWSKNFSENSYLKVDFQKKEMIYPENKGLKVNERQTCNFSSEENTVVFECVHRLLQKGYRPKDIELEPRWKLGHGQSGGRADIFVKDQTNNPLLLIECKTFGKEFEKEWSKTCQNGGQLFSYAQQSSEVKFLCLYASQFDLKAGQIDVEQRIIAHKDNEKILNQDPGMKSFEKANNVEKRFEVWEKTYQKEFTEKGIFEANIQTYRIGKSQYTLHDDTEEARSTDKDGKYHEFATILRKHNVARKETAFEVLVNLFLCKIVDEDKNAKNLKFYWKGLAYDNSYDFIDRLQELYKTGMQEFLNEEIMYISNEQIDEAFWMVKNNRNTAKKKIKEYFKDLKFYSNNAFSLIDVHNEKKFNSNTEILVDLVRMWQNLRLKTKEQNQFLGDMFEHFLDSSIKQSEGQYFTPIPITKFIVSSLPLKKKIKEKQSEALNVIDFACGSGHFLTEYAHQIQPFVKEHGQVDIEEYYKKTIGIEKEDRLAKISKVSVQMYGQGQIQIKEQDALVSCDGIQEKSFDGLVSNPPFAVKGFLENLTEEQRKKYELSKTANLTSDNVQCFFIERAKQLMAPGGVMGIIVPSSVLSNTDETHEGVRKIILKYFNIVALVELGSGTFGKTGTNTVVLFLERRRENPEPSEHYWNRVNDFFESDRLEGKESEVNFKEYQDRDLIERYCEEMSLPFGEYIQLFGVAAESFGRLKKLLEEDRFKEYRKNFEGSSERKDLRAKKWFKKLGKEKLDKEKLDKEEQQKEEQQFEENKVFIEYLQKIEREKLLYFILADTSERKVLVIRSPGDPKKQKQFLGYEWSGSKGSEGIQYLAGKNTEDIQTPLFNPGDFEDGRKLSTWIRQNFEGKEPSHWHDWEVLQKEYGCEIRYVKTAELLDFEGTDFKKTFSLSAKQHIEIETKWDLVKLGEITIINPSKSEIKNLNKDTVISFVEMSSVDNTGYIKKNIRRAYKELKKGSYTYFADNDIIIAKITPCMENGKCALVSQLSNGIALGSSEFHVIRTSKILNSKFLFILLNRDTIRKDAAKYMTGSSGHRRVPASYYANLKIPRPPLEIQQQIIEECEAIDQASQSAQQTITQAKAEIESKVTQEQKQNITLDSLLYRNSETIDPNSENGAIYYIGLENIESNTGKVIGKTNFDYSEIKSNKIIFIKDDILYGKLRPNLNKVLLADQDGICSTDILVLRSRNYKLRKFYKYYLMSKIFNEKVLNTVSGQQLPRTSWDKIKNFTIPVPPLEEQKKLIAEVELLENKIARAQQTIEQAPKQKQKILDKHLKSI